MADASPVAWSLLLIALLAPAGETSPATTTTVAIPESPAAGLSLDPRPVPAPEPASPRPAPAPTPVPLRPVAAWTAMAAGMAVLAARSRRISDAERTIRHSLQDNLFHDVGHDDLTMVATTLATLDPGEASAVVASLSDRELRVWLRELDGWSGGFGRHEEEALFLQLAGSLSPQQLARVAGHGKALELLTAIGIAASSRIQAESSIALWSQLDPTDEAWPRVIELFEASAAVDQEAATALTNPDSLLADLLSVQEVEGETPRVRLETTDRFLKAAASFEEPGLKAELFVAGQMAIDRKLHAVGGVEVSTVTGRLGSLLLSDPAGVIVQLSHGIDPHGDVFSEWVKSMIAADRLDGLDVLLAGLLGSPHRLAHFTDPGDDEARPYPHAANLGYYVGSYSLAIDDMADAAEDQITLVGRLFSIVTGIVPGPDNSWVRLPIGPLVDAHARSVVDGLRSQATTLKQTLWGLAKPRSEDGLLWNGAGTTQFQDAWEEVVAVR